jgi:hypothetical protein
LFYWLYNELYKWGEWDSEEEEESKIIFLMWWDDYCGWGHGNRKRNIMFGDIRWFWE